MRPHGLVSGERSEENSGKFTGLTRLGSGGQRHCNGKFVPCLYYSTSLFCGNDWRVSCTSYTLGTEFGLSLVNSQTQE